MNPIHRVDSLIKDKNNDEKNSIHNKRSGDGKEDKSSKSSKSSKDSDKKNSENDKKGKASDKNDTSIKMSPGSIEEKVVSESSNIEKNLQKVSSGLNKLIDQTKKIVKQEPLEKSIEKPVKEVKSERTGRVISAHPTRSLSHGSRALSETDVKAIDDESQKATQSISDAQDQVSKTVDRSSMINDIGLTNNETNGEIKLSNKPSSEEMSNNRGKNKGKSKENEKGKREKGKESKRKESKNENNGNNIKIIDKIKTNRPPSVVNGLNDSVKSAQNLAKKAKKIISSVNLPKKRKEKIISLANQIEKKAKIIKSLTEKIKKKTAIDLSKDSDGDGISDFAEITIYHTDPNNPDTDGDGLSDGNEIKGGFNPLKPNNDNIMPKLRKESPKTVKSVKPHLLKVNYVSNVIVENPKTKRKEKKIILGGQSLPNIYLTVYVYSTPIVAVVKTDSEGRWQLTINNRLENGSHEVYVALADSQGNLIARSNPTKFLVSAGLAVTENDLRSAANIGGFPWFSLVYYGLASLIILVGGLLIIMTTKKVR